MGFLTCKPRFTTRLAKISLFFIPDLKREGKRPEHRPLSFFKVECTLRWRPGNNSSSRVEKTLTTYVVAVVVVNVVVAVVVSVVVAVVVEISVIAGAGFCMVSFFKNRNRKKSKKLFQLIHGNKYYRCFWKHVINDRITK